MDEPINPSQLEALRQKAGLSYNRLTELVNTDEASQENPRNKTTFKTVQSLLQEKTKKQHDATLAVRIATILKEHTNPQTLRQSVVSSRKVYVYTNFMLREVGEKPPTFETVADWGSDTERFAILVQGDEMSPVLISGDKAIVEVREARAGEVVHAQDETHGVIGAMRIVSGERWIYPFNAEPYKLGDLEIQGVIVSRIRTTEFNIRQTSDFPGGLSWDMKGYSR